jgi:hypothetical protein
MDLRPDHQEGRMLIVGITGRAQHGKDTLAQMLQRHLEKQLLDVRIYRFAGALKRLLLVVNPVITPILRYGEIITQLGEEEAKLQYPEIRRLLQQLGTGVRDIVGEDAWVRALERELDERWADNPLGPPDIIIIPDVRFPNEADWVRVARSGILVRVVRPGVEAADPTHESERYVDTLRVDYEVLNDRTLRKLNSAAKQLAGFIDRDLVDRRLGEIAHSAT